MSIGDTLNKKNNSLILLVFVWTITTAFYLWKFGIVIDLEAKKYINQAELLISNQGLSEARYYFYLPTILIIAFSLLTKIGFTGAVIIQAIINLLSYLLFFKALKKLFPNSLIPIAIVVYLLLFWPYQSWIAFLFTESIFYSSILVLTSALILLDITKVTHLLLLGCSLLFVLISRPLGILFVGSVSVWLFYKQMRQKKMSTKLVYVTLILALAYFVVNLIFSTISDWYILKPFIEQNIICNLPTNNKPNNNLILDTNGSQLYQLGYYIWHNPSHFSYNMANKLKYFLLMKRDYYSKAHNVLLISNVIILSILSLFNVLQKNIMKNGLGIYIITTLILFTLSVILQCDDWHNRFILSIWPLIVISAGNGIMNVKTLLSSNNRNLNS